MKWLQLLTQILLVVAILGIAYVGWSYQSLVVKATDQYVWYTCAQAYHTEYSDSSTDTLIVAPNEVEVEECIRQNDNGE